MNLTFFWSSFSYLEKEGDAETKRLLNPPPATKKFPFTQSVHRIPLDVDVDLVDYLVEKISILKLSWPTV